MEVKKTVNEAADVRQYNRGFRRFVNTAGDQQKVLPVNYQITSYLLLDNKLLALMCGKKSNLRNLLTESSQIKKLNH